MCLSSNSPITNRVSIPLGTIIFNLVGYRAGHEIKDREIARSKVGRILDPGTDCIPGESQAKAAVTVRCLTRYETHGYAFSTQLSDVMGR